MPSVTQAIAAFLAAQESNNRPILDLYSPAMEVQVNVRPGTPVADKRNTWSDDGFTYHHVRVPRDANSEPNFRDYPLKFPLELFAQSIGMTGWDWQARRSVFVAFDFDSISGHAPGVGVGRKELEQVRQKASQVPWVEVRRSTRGRGYHLYVFLDAPTANHTEHAALARCVLGLLSSEAGFNFAGPADACGGNTWVWSRDAAPNGFELVSEATQRLDRIPANWRDHVDVVTKRRAKVRVRGVEDERAFDELAASRKTQPLDLEHRDLIDRLEQSGFSTLWLPDHNLLQTHTAALKQVEHVGIFDTLSSGDDPGTPNCFCFPLADGAWRVYRFSPGVQEAPSWRHDKWTHCYYNRLPDLATAALAYGAVERQNGAGYVLTLESASRVVDALGHELAAPDLGPERETILKRNQDGRIVAEIKRVEGDARPSGWEAKKGVWSRVLNVREPKEERDLDLDGVIRSLMTPSTDDAGWVVREASGRWRRTPKDNVKNALLHLGCSKGDADLALGGAVLNGWQLVNLPFQPEYPGGRVWNYQAAQHRFAPSPGEHPHWDMILGHIGQTLDGVCPSGADYLAQWIAALLRYPFEPLPYLFLYGPQNSGKSILHEAISLLMTSGVAAADRALTNSNDFNGELANAVLAYIDEKDISACGEAAYNKIKEWVTSRVLWVRKMRTDAYAQPNTLHFIQTANKIDACPIFPGDTRITLVYVPELTREVPKSAMVSALEAEAPAFMATLMALDLPEPTGRLRVPVLHTEHKRRAESFSRSSLETFLTDTCNYVPGMKTPLAEVHKAFVAWLPPDERGGWSSPRKLARSLPHQFPVGKSTGNKTFVGNFSFEPGEPGEPFSVADGRLVRSGA